MDRNREDRLRMVEQLLDAKSQASVTLSQYHLIVRELHGEGALRMREIHFILAVGPEGKTMTQLSQALCVTQGAVSQTAARLEERGYILRTRSEVNYRQIIATLTEQGLRAYEEHLTSNREIHDSFDRRFLSDYTDEELRFLRDYELRMNETFIGINTRLRKRLEGKKS